MSLAQSGSFGSELDLSADAERVLNTPCEGASGRIEGVLRPVHHVDVGVREVRKELHARR